MTVLIVAVTLVVLYALAFAFIARRLGRHLGDTGRGSLLRCAFWPLLWWACLWGRKRDLHLLADYVAWWGYSEDEGAEQ